MQEGYVCVGVCEVNPFSRAVRTAIYRAVGEPQEIAIKNAHLLYLTVLGKAPQPAPLSLMGLCTTFTYLYTGTTINSNQKFTFVVPDGAGQSATAGAAVTAGAVHNIYISI